MTKGGNVNEPPVRNVPRVQGLLTPCSRGLISFFLSPEYELQPLLSLRLILLFIIPPIIPSTNSALYIKASLGKIR